MKVLFSITLLSTCFFLPTSPLGWTPQHQSSTPLQPWFPFWLLALHHKNPIKLQEDDEDVLAGEEDHKLVQYLLLNHEVEPVKQEGAVLKSHREQQAPHFAGAAGGERSWSTGEAGDATRAPPWRLVLWGLCLGEHQRKLHERPREEGQANDDDRTVGFDLGFLEGVKDVQDISAQSHVDHEELGELVTRHVPLGHQPATQNQHYEHCLLQASHPVLWVQLHDALGEGRKQRCLVIAKAFVKWSNEFWVIICVTEKIISFNFSLAFPDISIFFLSIKIQDYKVTSLRVK